MKVLSTNEPIPADWHKATVREAEENKKAILGMMGQWYIAELEDGRMSGAGYGGKTEQQAAPEKLGHMVIIQNGKGDKKPKHFIN